MALYFNGNKIIGSDGTCSADKVSLDDTNLSYEADDVQEAFEKVTKSLTYDEYEALTDAEKNNGTIYLITDVNGDGQSFQPVIYSTEEREIGVWKDGKPLYQKTFIKTITCGSEQTLLDTTDLQDVDVIVDIFGNYGVIKLEHYDSSNYRSYITLAGTVVIGYVKWGNTSSLTAKVTIQYTKTTDVAGSGTWTPQGVPAHHYLTDEQIVGTWIDGSTLYEKTIENTSFSGGTFSITFSDTTINNLFIFGGYWDIGSGNKRELNAYVGNGYYGYVNADFANNLWSLGGGIVGYTPNKVVITVRYTKSST